LLVLAAVSIAPLVIAALSVAGGLALGIWLSKRLGIGNRLGEPAMPFREKLRRGRAERKKQLTAGERRFMFGYTLLSSALPPLSLGLVVWGSGTTRDVGIGLLLLALVVMAVPISPFLRARIRGRERRESEHK